MSESRGTWAEDGKLVFHCLNEIRDDVKSLCHDLNGNGKPGLKERVRNLEKESRFRKWALRVFVGSLITGAVGIGVAAVRSSVTAQEHRVSK